MTAPDAIRRKALSVLREGRVTVLSAASDPIAMTVTKAMVRIVGTRSTYVVDFTERGWECTCQRGMAGVRCGHILAAQLVLGHAETASARAA